MDESYYDGRIAAIEARRLVALIRWEIVDAYGYYPRQERVENASP